MKCYIQYKCKILQNVASQEEAPVFDTLHQMLYFAPTICIQVKPSTQYWTVVLSTKQWFPCALSFVHNSRAYSATPEAHSQQMSVQVHVIECFLICLVEINMSVGSDSVSFSPTGTSTPSSKPWFKYPEKQMADCLNTYKSKNGFELFKHLFSCFVIFKKSVLNTIRSNPEQTRIQRVTGNLVMAMNLQDFVCWKNSFTPNYAAIYRVPLHALHRQIYKRSFHCHYSSCLCYHFVHKLSFDLNRQISANVTVHELFLSSGPLDTTQFYRFEFLLFVSYRSYFYFHSEFSVVNSKSVFCTQWSQNSLIYPVLLVETNKDLRIIVKIIVEKRLYLLVSCLRSAVCEVFDGPGILSPVVQSTNNIYKLSTFICMVIINHSRTKIISSSFNYSSIKHGNSVNIKDINTTTQLCFSLNGQLEIISFFEPKGQQLNITLLELIFVGKAILFKGYHLDASSCGYAGIVAVEQIGKYHQETFTLCNNHSHRTAFSRSFYSFDSELLVIGYSFSNYGKVDVLMLLSKTKCRSVLVNICEHKETPFSIYASKNIDFNFYNLNRHKYSEKIVLTEHKCFTFQFYQQIFEVSTYLQYTLFVFNPCIKSFNLYYNQEQNILTYFDIRAVFKYPLLLNEKNSLLQKPPIESDLEHLKCESLFQKKRHRACIRDGHHMQCGRRQTRIIPGNTLWRNNGIKNTINVLMNAVFYPKFSHNSDFLGINLFPHTESWVDMTISASLNLQKTQTEPLNLDQGHYNKGSFDIVLPARPNTTYYTPLEFQASKPSSLASKPSSLFALKLNNLQIQGEISFLFGSTSAREQGEFRAWFYPNRSQDYVFFSFPKSFSFAHIDVSKYENKSIAIVLTYFMIDDNFNQEVDAERIYTCLNFVPHYTCKRVARLTMKETAGKKLSWLDSNKECLSINGTLPYFTNEREFKDFMLLVKDREYRFEYIFIGLQSGKQKVTKAFAFELN